MRLYQYEYGPTKEDFRDDMYLKSYWDYCFENLCEDEINTRAQPFLDYLDYLENCNGGDADKLKLESGTRILDVYMAFRRYTLTDDEEYEIREAALEMYQEE